MQVLLTPRQMQKMEQRYFEATHTASLEVMERAAAQVNRVVCERFGAHRRVFFACGPGGNGGDGLAAARLYQRSGGEAAFVLAGEVTAPDARENLRRAREAGVSQLRLEDAKQPDVWVDALFGTGLSRPAQGAAAALLARMAADRRRGSAVVAVDIPSGLSGLSGERMGAIDVDLTVTFQCAKTGHYLGDGLDCCGEIIVCDIGIPEAFLPPRSQVTFLQTARDCPPEKSARNVHKGTRGHVLVVAGSMGMAGAAALCAGAALRGGAGLVTLACPASIVPIVQALEPCAMCVGLPEEDGALCAQAVAPLRELLAHKRAVVVGPGLSRRCPVEIIATVLRSEARAVVDADALNLLAESPETVKLLSPRHCLTPHPGEARRLLGRELRDPIDDARALSLLGGGCTAVFKGASRVIARAGDESDAAARISASGCSGMAKGGSGDVFAGLLAAQWDGLSTRTVARACEIHGLAGGVAQKRRGEWSMCAGDILEALSEAFAIAAKDTAP